MFVRYRSIGLAILFLAAAQAHASDPSPLWGRLANPPFANERIRTTLFFSGQASDGSNPYGIADPPESRLFLYTAHPVDDRHLRWSESAANRDFALSQMVSAGINVVTMSSWGESFLDALPRPPWAVYAPMQTSPASHDELFAAAVGKPLLVTPLIESRGDWNFRNEFPHWQGAVAPGTVSQIVDLVNRYLKNNSHPEWADRSARVYDRDGQERYAVALIHASSNQLAADEHAAYAQGFAMLADEVLARTGVNLGFLLDVLPRDSFAPGSFRPTPELTGPELFEEASILGIQSFLPEIWANVPSETARINWKRDFSSRWAATGIPFLMDVAPGYDAHIVFPGSLQYGHNPTWLNAMATMVNDFGQDGLVYNSWNGYTEAMLAVASREHGGAYYLWLRTLTALHALSGDFNQDGFVDAADYVVWRRGLADGTMNASHFDEWTANFGATAGAEAARASGTFHGVVPEPGSLILAAIGLAAIRAVRRLGRPAMSAPSTQKNLNCGATVVFSARPASLVTVLRFPPGR
jgi:hypothetical protein